MREYGEEELLFRVFQLKWLHHSKSLFMALLWNAFTSYVYVYASHYLHWTIGKMEKFLENNRVESENLMSFYCWIKLQFIVSQRPINIIKIMLNHLQLLTQCITCKNWVILSLKFIIICTSTFSNKLVRKINRTFFYNEKYSLFNE